MAPSTATSTVRDALAAAADGLGAAGVEQPRLDAELLMERATGWDRAQLAAEPEAGLSPAPAREFASMVRRRLRREPVAYILGRKGFRAIELDVDPRVLIPRPETELLVEVGVELGPASVIEVGTGSGAVALALAEELPGAAVTATDTSPRALEVARANAARLGLGGRVAFQEGTLPEARRFELLLANLPYVSEAEWDELAPEIREFEPREALVPGPTGLEAIEALLAALAAKRERPAAVALEVGAGQASQVAELAAAAGYPQTEVREDLAGIERVVLGRG